MQNIRLITVSWGGQNKEQELVSRSCDSRKASSQGGNQPHVMEIDQILFNYGVFPTNTMQGNIERKFTI